MSIVSFLILFLQITAMTGSSVIKKHFKKNTPIFFSSVAVFFSLLFFVVALFVTKGFDFSGFSVGLLRYSLPFGAMFAASSIFNKLALDSGDFSLTSLFANFSLLIPTLYGIFFLNDPIGIAFWIALPLFLTSIVIVNVDFSKGAKRKPASLKWLFYAAMFSVCNGLCSTFQAMQQREYNGLLGDESMIFSLSFAVIILIAATFLTKERELLKDASKSAFTFGCPTGIVMGLNNLLVIILVGHKLFPVSILFPLISGLGLIFSFVLGRFLYKEKYKPQQYVGLLCGFISVILFNL